MRILSGSAALAALLLAACAPAGTVSTAVPAEATPALWKLADADTSIYLFGTIHALPPGYKWRDAKLDAAFKRADTLVLEAVLDHDPHKASALLMGLGRSAGLPPLIERLPADKRAQLTELITRSKLPTAFLDGMETWAAALMLVGVTLSDLGVGPDDGVERQLETEFTAAGKPIEGLETPAQQLGYFDSLPEAAQREFLLTLLDDPGKAKTEFAEMLAAWSKGDEKGIAATFDDELELSPHLREVLLAKRNAIWTEWLAKRLDKPGAVLVAVGAGHLAGPGSVVALLEAKGFKVERVQ
jgi:uncharacterized protein YbaP (TraB family)